LPRHWIVEGQHQSAEARARAEGMP